MKRIPFLLATVLSTAHPVLAQGLAIQDFQQVQLDLSNFKGGTYDSLREADRIIIACESCSDLTSVLVEKGRSTDGTEGRFRSGETTVERMQEICRQNAPDCVLTRTDVGGAVGWTTKYATGSIVGSTTVLFAQGDVLTIRSMGSERATVDANMKTAVRTIATQIVGN